MIVKLTNVANGTPAYINTGKVEGLYDQGTHVDISISDDTHYEVRESIEEVHRCLNGLPTEYRIVCASSTGSLSDTVMACFDSGWELHGTFVRVGDYYKQAMVR